MSRVLAISPHLDDAIFSAGGTLAGHAVAGDEVTVLTCFTGNVARPAGFALECQLDKTIGAEVDYMALRRAEDLEACAVIGARAMHLPFLEAPHRGYASAAELFAGMRPSDAIVTELNGALAAILAELAPDMIYGPFAVGNHVDHQAVRLAMERLGCDRPVLWWEDYPYAMREALPSCGIERRELAPAIARCKKAAVRAYRSQIGFQFGGAGAADRAFASWICEGFAPLRAPRAG